MTTDAEGLHHIVERAAGILQKARGELELLSSQTEALYQDYLAQWLEEERGLESLQAPGGEALASTSAEGAALRQQCAQLDYYMTRLRQVSYKLELLLRHSEDDENYLEDSGEEFDPARWRVALSPIRIVQSQEEERQRIARDLQERIGQLLANAVLELEYYDRAAENNLQMAREGLLSLKEELREGLSEVRWLISELSPPPLLGDLGLACGLKRYTEKYAARFGIEIDLDLDGLEERLPGTMEVTIFRIVQESLKNIRKHAGATQVTIHSRRQPDVLVFTIEDNGRGFAPELLADRQAGGLGLINMRDRAALLGGRLQVFNRQAGGVRVVLSVPYPFDGR